MSRHPLFVLLPLLLLIGCTCGPARAQRAEQPKNSVDLFVPKKTEIPGTGGNSESKKEVESFASPLLVAADGVMVALAEAHFPSENHVNVGVAARYIGTQGGDWAQKAVEDDGKNWVTQLAIASKKVDKNEDGFLTSASLSVVKGNKIYLLAVGLVGGEVNAQIELKSKVSFELAVGEVTDSGSKTVQWRKLGEASTQLTKEFQNRSVTLFSSRGYGFLTEDERIVFVIDVQEQNHQTTAAIISSVGEEETKWELSPLGPAGDCSSFALFGWKGKLMMIPASCNGGDDNLRRSADMEAVWRDTNGPFSYLWGKLQNKEDLTTATIGKRTVLLFTHVSYKMDDIAGHLRRHLGFTDGKRIYDVGPIVVSDDYSVISGGLLHTNGELVFLHQQWDRTKGRVTLTRLSNELETIKSVLKTWAERDAYLSRPCEETAPEGAPVGTLCLTPMPTDAVVGFLSNHASKDTWQDEYLYLNATVKGGTKVDNGFVFKGTNAGARWAVGYQGFANMHYSLTHGATVVATVTVHEVPQDDDSPLLTVGGIWKKRLGLWYSGDKQWKVRSESDGEATHAGGLVTNEAYRVALVLRNGNISAYVDGRPVGEPLQLSEQQGVPLDIADIFIGSYKEDNVMHNGVIPNGVLGDDVKNTDSHVTVTNVLLYNRPLSDAELTTLNMRTVEKPKSGNSGGSSQQLSGGDDAQKKDRPPKMTGRGDDSVHVPAAGVLLFVLSLWGISGLCWTKGNTLI